MVGQHKNLMTIEYWKRNNKFPRFILIIGDFGSGRFTLSQEIIKCLNAQQIVLDKTISDVRKVISNSYEILDKFCYVIRDIDEMSVNAKNSILKVIEEPPNEAYFIMTSKNEELVLDTVKSRAFILHMQPYTEDELREFNTNETILRYCNTPGMCIETDGIECTNLSGLVENILLSIKEKKGSTLIKYCRDLSNKDKSINYDLFWSILFKEITYSDIDFNIKKAFLNNLNDIPLLLKNKSINSKMLLETFLLNVYNEVKLNATS